MNQSKIFNESVLKSITEEDIQSIDNDEKITELNIQFTDESVQVVIEQDNSQPNNQQLTSDTDIVSTTRSDILITNETSTSNSLLESIFCRHKKDRSQEITEDDISKLVEQTNENSSNNQTTEIEHESQIEPLLKEKTDVSNDNQHLKIELEKTNEIQSSTSNSLLESIFCHRKKDRSQEITEDDISKLVEQTNENSSNNQLIEVEYNEKSSSLLNVSKDNDLLLGVDGRSIQIQQTNENSSNNQATEVEYESQIEPLLKKRTDVSNDNQDLKIESEKTKEIQSSRCNSLLKTLFYCCQKNGSQEATRDDIKELIKLSGKKTNEIQPSRFKSLVKKILCCRKEDKTQPQEFDDIKALIKTDESIATNQIDQNNYDQSSEETNTKNVDGVAAEGNDIQSLAVASYIELARPGWKVQTIEEEQKSSKKKEDANQTTKAVQKEGKKTTKANQIVRSKTMTEQTVQNRPAWVSKF